MENGRSSKVVAIVALCVGVVGLSLGFAAFSNTLTISSSASVKPNADTFNVDFSSAASGAVATDAIAGQKSILEGATGAITDFTAESASISNANNPTITNLHASFTAPGQSVKYTFYAYNVGELKAFLNSVTFANAKAPIGEAGAIVDAGAHKYCLASENEDGSETDQTKVNAACNGITISVRIGDDASAQTTTPLVFTGSDDSVDGQSLDAGVSEVVEVTISYDTNAARADGNFDVYFGDISLVYGSVDTE